MAPFSSILCSIDFSDHSRHALHVAMALAARRHAPLRLVHVIDLLLAQAAAVAYDEQRLRTDATAELRSFAAAERSAVATWVEPTVEVRIGHPHHEILEAAKEHGADLLVMGTHGLGGFRKLFFGSVTERVLRSTPVPVLAVPIDERHRVSPEPVSFSGVLAAIELDSWSVPIGTAAHALAAAFDAPLTLVHVVPPVQAAGAWTTSFGEELPQRMDQARVELERIAEIVAPSQPPRIIVRNGAPAEEIADAALEHPHTLIAIGLCGGSVLHRPGSTAYRVLCLSTVPVIGLPLEAMAALAGTVTTTARVKGER
jgi:nucleotide-binding universal stress UspA family protein